MISLNIFYETYLKSLKLYCHVNIALGMYIFKLFFIIYRTFFLVLALNHLKSLRSNRKLCKDEHFALAALAAADSINNED